MIGQLVGIDVGGREVCGELCADRLHGGYEARRHLPVVNLCRELGHDMVPGAGRNFAMNTGIGQQFHVTLGDGHVKQHLGARAKQLETDLARVYSRWEALEATRLSRNS